MLDGYGALYLRVSILYINHVEGLWLIRTVVNAKYEAEHHLRQLSDVDYTIIRPGGLSNESATGAKLGKVGVGLTR